MCSAAPMHAVIKAKRAVILSLQANKKVDTRQIEGLLKSILRLEKQASQYTEEAFSARMLEGFKQSIIKINSLSKHWRTLDAAMIAYKALPNREKILIYHSPIDSTFIVLDLDRAKKLFSSKMRPIAIDLGHRHTNGIFSPSQYRRIRRRLANMHSSFHSYLGRNSIDVKKYKAPITQELSYPSNILLTEFHICGRKQLYAMFDKAQKAAIRNKLEVYTCVFCSGYHIGHGSADNDYRYMIGSTFYARHRTTWKRYPEKAKAFLEKRNIVLDQ